MAAELQEAVVVFQGCKVESSYLLKLFVGMCSTSKTLLSAESRVTFPAVVSSDPCGIIRSTGS